MQAIKQGAYIEERDWTKWVIWDSGANPYVSLVQIWRTAAYARDVLKRPVHMISGYRTFAQQLALYLAWKAGRGQYANPPGTSWHEFSCAVDVHGPGTNYPELVLASKLVPSKQSLAPYGLAVTNYVGNPRGTPVEWWHLMCVETMNYVGVKKDFLQPEDEINGDDTMKSGDNGPNVYSWQDALVAEGSWAKGDANPPAPNGNFGPYTVKCTNIFKASKGLVQDGVVDENTWAKMMDSLRAVTLIEVTKQKKETERVQSLIDNYLTAFKALA